MLLGKQSLSGGKPIDEIEALPALGKLLVVSGPSVLPSIHHQAELVSDRRMYFFTYPNLDPIPPDKITPIKGVRSFFLDERPLPSPKLGQPPHPVEFCVAKQRSITLYSVRDTVSFRKVSRYFLFETP